MPRLRPPQESKEAPKTLKSAIDNGSMDGLGEEVVVEEPETEVEVETAPEEQPKQDDAVLTLQKQLEELKKSEAVAREQAARFMQEREQALQKAREREAQLSKVQKEAYDSQFDAISSALAAAQAEADKAQLDIENAISLGDAKGQAEAHRRLAMATANLSRLQEGKDAAEARNKEIAEQKPQPADPLENSPLPQSAKDYLRKHPDLLTDPRKNARLQAYHWDALDEGLVEFSPPYYEFMDIKFKYTQPEQPSEQPQPKPRAVNVSAPVSREVPNADGKRPSGKITLTKEEQEMARISNVSLEEYAKQKVLLQQKRASGEYGDQR